MALGLLDRQVDRARRLGADDKVDVVLAAQAVRDDADARVGVGGEAARRRGSEVSGLAPEAVFCFGL